MITPARTNQILKYSAGAVSIGAPAVYMTHFHDKFYTEPLDRKRMLNKQLGFWGGMAAGVAAIHNAFRKHRKNKPLMMASIAFMAVSSYAGVQVAKAVNKTFLPKKQMKHHHQMQPVVQKSVASSPAFEAFLKSYTAK